MTEHLVRKSVTVEASREIAFEVFTARMTTWWPAEHRIGKSPLAEIVLEPRVGGRWAERGTDGSECDWGRVLAWDPPSRFVLAWQLDADYEYDPKLETEVEVRFLAESPTRTRVELEHRHLDRYGAREAELRASFESGGGWQLGLDRFAAAAGARAAKKYFVLRLLPPRPTFAADMNDAERRAMEAHVAYWAEYVQKGIVLALGPVADPKGVWGICVLEVEDQALVKKLTDEDPAIRADIGVRYEVLPMVRAIVRG